MTKRLQVLLDDEEYFEIQRLTQRDGVTVSDWVRQALRKARSDTPRSVDANLRAIEKVTKINGPTADIEVMLREIESGYISD